MNDFSKVISISIILLSMVTSVSFANNTPDFESLYAEMKAAMANRNESAILALLAPEFFSEDIFGNRTDTKTMIKNVLNLPKDPNRNSKTVLLSIEIKESIAEIRQQYTMTSLKKTDYATPVPVKLVAISDDLWKKIDGKWYIFQTVTKEMQYIIDGKIIRDLKHK